ncbi:alkaline phosphatase family protein [Polaribacter sp. Z014]|uniref:alkaline phosphatase D family protein n=1 Tax=Polaribacter sp. Z014 TaxID=2927126 RepID=UPI002022755D|nr:alkaline phosphatase D family protein [Polaribacter sp. Z014]MCL7763530.1 alkaline phosphatase family protein [Polaribacter sp. Z014]
MKNLTNFIYLLVTIALVSCSSSKNSNHSNTNDFTIAFGSCNKQYLENILWKEIKKNKPNLWIWGGDNIYSDTHNMDTLRNDYLTLRKQKGYLDLVENIPVMATWDDHDYGLNDSGVESPTKKEAQQIFLDFFNVDKTSPRRLQEGVYHSEVFNTTKGSIKVIVLDTRYFRSALTKDTKNSKRFTPNTSEKGTILGKTQWEWFIKELNTSKADFNIITSSIQVLAAEHGFETWGNFPNEVDKLKQTIIKSKAKGVLLLSGDRHISEFSKTAVPNLSYPLIDFTSSGLTHSYSDFTKETNKYRVQNVVSKISFGLLKFNFKKKEITMEMRGKNNKLQQELTQVYP